MAFFFHRCSKFEFGPARAAELVGRFMKEFFSVKDVKRQGHVATTQFSTYKTYIYMYSTSPSLIEYLGCFSIALLLLIKPESNEMCGAFKQQRVKTKCWSVNGWCVFPNQSAHTPHPPVPTPLYSLLSSRLITQQYAVRPHNAFPTFHCNKIWMHGKYFSCSLRAALRSGRQALPLFTRPVPAITGGMWVIVAQADALMGFNTGVFFFHLGWGVGVGGWAGGVV